MEELHQILSAEPIDDKRVRVMFDTGAFGVFDCSPYMRDDYWASLRSPAFFRLVRVECGMLCWPGDIDIAPEDVWEDAERVEGERVKR